MRVLIVISFAILFASCEVETHFKFCSNTMKVADAAFARDTFGIKKTEQLSWTLKMMKWDWNWQNNYASLSWWNLSVGDILRSEPLLVPVIDSMGILSLDSAQYNETVFNYKWYDQHFWILPDSLIKDKTVQWKHSIVNTGTLPIKLKAIESADTSVRVEFDSSPIAPGDSMIVRFSRSGPFEKEFKIIVDFGYIRDKKLSDGTFRSTQWGFMTSYYLAQTK